MLAEMVPVVFSSPTVADPVSYTGIIFLVSSHSIK